MNLRTLVATLLIAVASLLLSTGTVAPQERSDVSTDAEREALLNLIKRSKALIDIGEYALAIELCNQAIKLDPQLAEAYSTRGYALHGLDRNAEAIKSYNQAIKLDPQLAEAYKGRGYAQYNLGEYAEAIKSFDQAIKLGPQLVHAYYNRGRALAELGEYAAAIKSYEQVKRLLEAQGNTDSAKRISAIIKRMRERE